MVTLWEVSIKELKTKKKTVYKITRRLPELGVSETKIVISKEEALRQLQEWSK